MNDQRATLVCAEMHGYVGNPTVVQNGGRDGRRQESCQGPLAANRPLPQGYTCSSFCLGAPCNCAQLRRGPAGCSSALRACSLPPRCLEAGHLSQFYCGFSIRSDPSMTISNPLPYLRIFVKMRSKGSPVKTQMVPISEAPPTPCQ